MLRRTCLAALAGGALSAATTAPQPVDVFRAGDDGYHTFRIPALLSTKKGTLLAFAEGRRGGRGDSGDIDVVLKRSTDQGRTWSALQTVADRDADTIGNPCPVQGRSKGRI